MDSPTVKVTSPSFCKQEILVRELNTLPCRVVLNLEGQRLQGASLKDFLKEADGAIVGLEKIDADLLDACPSLRIVSKFGVGLDNVDLAACKDRGITVGWTPGVNRRSVAEMTVGLIVGLSRNLFSASRRLSTGVWEKNGGKQLTELCVGIIGLGNVGQELVRLLKPFGCQILANDIADRRRFCGVHHVMPAAKEEIFGIADVVTLHVPLTAETRRMINVESLSLMKKDSFLINTSRGGVVDEAALKWALQQQRIGGAALDVYEEEPPQDLELLQLPQLVCTPHIAGNAREAVLAMGRSAIRHLVEYFGHRQMVPQPSPFNTPELHAAA